MKTEIRERSFRHPSRPRSARILLGALLVLAGIGWLLDEAGIIEFPAGLLAPAALIIVGLLLVAGSGHRRSGGLIWLGLGLVAFLTLSSSDQAGVTDGLGSMVEAPATVAQLRSHYHLAAGSLRLDLSRIEAPSGSTNVTAHVGVGELEVVVPRGIDVDISARTGGGEIVVFGRRVASGAGARSRDRGLQFGESRLVLDLSVGLGPIRVIRGT